MTVTDRDPSIQGHLHLVSVLDQENSLKHVEVEVTPVDPYLAHQPGEGEYDDTILVASNGVELVIGQQEQTAQIETLCAQWLKYTDAIASRYSRTDEREDVQQVARLGLIKAARGFRPELEIDFRAYLLPTVLGEMRRYFRDHTWALKVPRRVKEVYKEVAEARADFTALHLREPSVTELAGETRLPEELICECLFASDNARRIGSLDTRATPNSELTKADTLVDPSTSEIDETAVTKQLIRRLVEELPIRERKVMLLRYWQRFSQAAIGEEVGLSQVQVSRIIRKLHKLMQTSLQNASITTSDETNYP